MRANNLYCICIVFVYYPGIGQIEQKYNQAGFAAVGIGYEHTRDGPNRGFENMLDSYGYLTALRFATGLKRGGLAHIAVVCGNMVFLCKAKTGNLFLMIFS